MFYCPICATWITKTILSQVLNAEADAALHRLEHTNPVLAGTLYVVTLLAVAVVAAKLAPKILRWLRT